MNAKSDADGRLAALEASVEALTARVQELEDDRAIRDVLARYGFTADSCDDEGFVDLYTDDGSINLNNRQAAATMGKGDVVGWSGRDGIRRFITNPEGHHRPELYGKSMHLQGNNLVTEVEGSEARAKSYQVALVIDEKGVRVLSAGNNQWQLRKMGGEWLIRERRGSYLGEDSFTTNLDSE